MPKSILIADCDSWQGYYAASALAKLSSTIPTTSIHAAARCSPTANPYALDLSLHSNVHLRTYDPQSDTNDLLALNDIDTLILIPAALDTPAHTLAQSMVRAAEASARCSRIIVWSTAAVEEMDVLQSIERLVLDSTGIQDKVVVRPGFMFQYLFGLAPHAVQDRGKVPWVSPAANKFAPVDAKDVAMLVAKLATMDTLGDEWNSKAVTVVGPEEVSGIEVVDCMNQAVGGDEVQLQEEAGADDMKKELEEGHAMDPFDVQLTLAFMRLLQQDKLHTLYDLSTDLASVLGKPATRLSEFLEANAAAFRGQDAGGKVKSFKRPTGPRGKVEGGGKVLTEEEAKHVYQEE